MRALSLVLAVSLALAGCEMLAPKKIDYKSATKLPPTLDVPPDLVAPTGDNRYAIPEAQSASATASGFAKERTSASPVGAAGLLPQQDKARIERAGTQRWLVVQASPQQVWPVIKDFWQETGFVVNLEAPETGVLETDWAENRAKIPQDGLRSLLGKVIDGVYSTPERDKFRTRIEANGKNTEIYISHRGMMEVYESEGRDKTLWQPRPADPELEAEMLRRLMVRFGVEKAQAESLIAGAQTPDAARIVTRGDATGLDLDEGFDRAWRRVGLALDRVGFAVEDRDRSKGIYFVRFIDPQVDNDSKRDEGLFAKFAFWKSGKTAQTAQQLQIQVGERDGKSRVTVTNAPPETQTRIVNLLYKELK
jgi:outer membrane protein assembly factor BamC